MNYAYLIAGGVSAFALVMHILLGRARTPPGVNGPSTQGDPMLRLDAAYGRHGATILMAAMALGFGHASRPPVNDPLAVTLAAMALALAGLRLVLAIFARAPRLDYAQWALLALAGLIGAIGFRL
jgi:hypothetical protein